MAVPKYVQTDNRVIVTWSNLGANESSTAHETKQLPSMAVVQFEGIFGNATATLQGSVSGIAYVGATDMKQVAISATSNSAVGVLEPFVYWRPTITGNAQTNVTVTLAYWTQR